MMRAAFLVVLMVGAAAAAPLDSDLGAARVGGGCYPTGINPALLDMLTLVNPEWAPVTNGQTVDSDPVLIHGVVEEMHGDLSGDFPSTHIRADVNAFIRLDAADEDRLATGNDDGRIHLEWEAGAYPAWAWPGAGDRIAALGRWIFDCGHTGADPGNCSLNTARQCVTDSDCRPPICAAGCDPGETCIGSHFQYSSELHPPHATAVIRSGRGAVLSTRRGATAKPAARADIYVSADGGGAGDKCIISHRDPDAALLSIECFPLAQPAAKLNAQDFSFDLPLPPRPPRGALRVRRIPYPAPGDRRAVLSIRRHLIDASPHLTVTVRMARRSAHLPTGFAGTVVAGWRRDPTPLTHVRTTVSAVVIHNALQRVTPLVPKFCSTSLGPCSVAADCPGTGETCLGVGPVRKWVLQAAVNGEWQELDGLDVVNTNDVIPETAVYDQYLPAAGAVHLEANGHAKECIDTMYGKSLATDLVEMGFNKGIVCLASTAHSPGQIGVSYGAPDFGAGTGTMDYETTSTGGEGGACSTAATLCVVDADCPMGETCQTVGGAFALRYRIERLP
jgi:hypothetical protein